MQHAGKPVYHQQVEQGSAEAARQAHDLEAAGPSPAPAITEFNSHLDACARCRTQPFNLCATGARLLGAALVAAPITRYACPNHCETTGQPAPEKCKHGYKQVGQCPR